MKLSKNVDYLTIFKLGYMLGNMLEQRIITEQGRRAEVLTTRTPVLVAGLPGRMATLVAEELARNEGYELLPFAMTSKRHRTETIQLGNQRVKLNDYVPFDIRQRTGAIAVDYSTPQTANSNALEYTLLRLPFVMGTTGGNREELEALVRRSPVSVVIAPNMAVEVVTIQDELNAMLVNTPEAFEGWNLTIRESHQATKKDVSGTAVAFQRQLEALGATMDGKIESIRDPQAQRELGIQSLDGHAYHWITLTSPDGDTRQFRTSIEGRQVYIAGTLMAIDFLNQRMKEGSRGEVFTMSDVIRGRRNHE